ncbi:MAG: inverse autotransporter beta domain-containing protein [Planctomycetales bacterium]|nr:inverse autotransporter beta domain-containing protein [Planctomycetales bacterium]
MNVLTKHCRFRCSMGMSNLLWFCLGLGMLLSSRIAVGQPPMDAAAESRTNLEDNLEDQWLSGQQFTGETGEAFGALFRAGVFTGPTIGEESSIVPFELMPYAFSGNGMLFGNIRGFRATSDRWGTNLGGGYRYFSERFDRIFGANVFYDYDNTSGQLFQQTGFGVEALGSLWDFRANAYFPNGVTEKQISLNFVSNSEVFSGHKILYDQQRIIGNALTGVDMELVTPVPGRIMKRHDVRAAAGWYTYQGQELDAFAGWKARLQGDVIPSVQLQVEITNDPVFDTNVSFGATWTYGGFRQPDDEPKTQFGRMTERVRRNYNVIVAKTKELDVGLTAVNPQTGLPYFVEHVASYAPALGANGTVEHPWQTISQAQQVFALPPPPSNLGNIIFVHANSVFNNTPVVLQPSIRVLGEGNGVTHQVNVAGIGLIPLPRATAFPDRPIFENTIGNGVKLATGTINAPTEFSGFQIGRSDVPASGTTGIGIFGNGVSDVVISQTDVNFSKGDGIFLQDLTGPVVIRGSVINNTGNINTGISGLHVLGGSGKVVFGDDTVSGNQGKIINSGGQALLVDSTLATSTLTLTDAEILDTLGEGILLNQANGLIAIGDATINSSSVTGIDIQGGGANINFLGTVKVDDATGDSINIQDTLAASTVTFSQSSPGVSITNRNGRGIDVRNNAAAVTFRGPVFISGNGTPAAVEYQNNSGNLRFNLLDIGLLDTALADNTAGGDGILIGELGTDNLGLFQVTGNTTIRNFLGDGIRITDDGIAGTTSALFNGVNISNRGKSGINIDNIRGNVNFTGTTSVDNDVLPAALGALVSTSSAVDIQNNNATSNINFTTLNITNATRPTPLVGGAGLNVINNPGSVIVNELNATTNNGIALYADNAGVTTLNPSTAILSTGNGGLIVTRGVINGGTYSDGTNTLQNTVGREAIHVKNSVIQLAFNSVSDVNSDAEGIRLQDNVAIGNTLPATTTTASNFNRVLFTISGQPFTPGSGGTIDNSRLNGGFFENTGGVSLSNVNFTNNGGVSGTTINGGLFAQTAQLVLAGLQVQTNNGVGIDVVSTPFFSMFGSIVSNNDLNQVRFTAASTPPVTTTNGVYSVTLGNSINGNGNQIAATSTDDAILIRTQGSGVGTTINPSIVNNSVLTSGIGSDPINMAWNGTVGTPSFTGLIALNRLTFSGDNSTGVSVDLPSATRTSKLDILTNVFSSPAGSNSTGISLKTSGGASNVNIGTLAGQLRGNSMALSSTGTLTTNVAMKFALGANTRLNIFDNDIDMGGTLLQGLQFTTMQGPTFVGISGNRISLVGGALDPFNNVRGINILGVSGSVALFGIQNNDVSVNGFRGTGVPYFFAPAGSVSGGILVNGIVQP